MSPKTIRRTRGCILHRLSIGAEQFCHDPLIQGTNDVQELSKPHDLVSKSKTELWHPLPPLTHASHVLPGRGQAIAKQSAGRGIPTHDLPLCFPEAGRFHRSSRSDWFLVFLERYPSPHFIQAMSRDAFIADAGEVIGRRVSKEHLLSDIYDTAASSIGLPLEPDSEAILMSRMVLAEGRSLIGQRNRIEARAVELLSDHPDDRLLCTIPGIGPINALTVLAEAGDLRRFGHHRQFLKFCGMDLATIRSGPFRGQTKLSKSGNARLRRAFRMAGQLAIPQRARSFRDKFGCYITKDRHNAHLRRKAYTAIAATLSGHRGTMH